MAAKHPGEFANENEFQDSVINMAHLFRWKVAHFRPAQTKHGWRTPVSADGKGFPDLILVRDRVVVIELKMPGNKPSPEQEDWLETFRLSGTETYLWYPVDWPKAQGVLQHNAESRALRRS